MRRSLLFIPGNNPAMIQNADVFPTDAVIFDLEDAVALNEKDAARILVRNALQEFAFGGKERIVRINSVETDHFEKDLKDIVPANVDSILLPKTEKAEDVKKLDTLLTEIENSNGIIKKIQIIVLVETALGLMNLYSLLISSARINGVFLGAEDLTADIGALRTKEGKEISWARSLVVTAASAIHIDAIDTPFTDINDDEGLERDAAFAKQLGFTGKAVITPKHCWKVNEVFSPTPNEIVYAQRVIDAIREAEVKGKGAIALDGKMIDAPIVNRAKKVLEMAKRGGLVT